MVADLHLHTHYSDGTFSPAELVAHAKERNLDAIALTDHDTVEGCKETAEFCRKAELTFVPGTELTAEISETEIHILGYFLDTANEPLLAAMRQFQDARQQRIHEMVGRLNKLEIPLGTEEVFALANCRSPGRPHVARALVIGGHCQSHGEAFDRFLKKGKPAWAPKFKLSSEDAIALIHQARGLAVLAHPALNRVDGSIPTLVGQGLDGLECFHSRHDARSAARYEAMARELGLLITGGSDCHGRNKGEPLIGTVRLPHEHVKALQARAEAISPTPS